MIDWQQPMGEDSRTHDEWHVLLQDEREAALAELFDAERGRLRAAVELRMDHKLVRRIDPSDIIQESFVEAQERLDKYLDNPSMSPYLWIRFLTLQRLITHYRRHVGAKVRDVRREFSLDAAQLGVSSACLAARLVDEGSTPSEAVLRAERRERLQKAIDALDPTDREVVALRHFEQLSNRDTANALGLRPAAASQRYLRALRRLKDVLGEDAR